MNNNNKNILICTGIFPPDSGGPANYSKLLLKELPGKGCDVKVVTYADDLSQVDNVFKINRKQNILVRYFHYFQVVNKNIDWADVVYIQGLISEGLPSFIACKLRRKKYTLKIVGDYAWEQGKQRFGVSENLDDFQDKKCGIKVELMRKLQRMVVRNAEMIITPSQYLKNIIKKWGIADEKINVIYNAVSLQKNLKNKKDVKKSLNINKDIILSVSRLVPWKGFETLIEIIPELLKVNPNFKLLIGGEGPDFDMLAGKIKELKLENNIELLGRVEQKLLFDYMAGSEMFVLNTSYEGLSHLIIEAMNLKLPVVTTRVGGNAELIQDNKSGILVEYNNKKELIEVILKIWQDKEATNSFVENAKQDVEKLFNKEIMIEKLVELFKV